MQGFRINRGNSAQTLAARTRSAIFLRGRLWRLAAAACLLAAPGLLYAQEALRQSLAGEAAASAQHRAAQSEGYYNLKMGDLTFRFSSGGGIQYNDNIRLSDNHPEGDLLLTPTLNTQIHYPVSQYNSLDISIGAGYTKYLNHSDLDQFHITPGSGLLYNIYVGDFVINLHERVSITQNGYQNAAANGNGNNASLNNTVGTSVTWDLESVVLQSGYDHVNYIAMGSGVNTPDSASDNVYANAGARLRPELMVGVEAGASSVTYKQSVGGTAEPDTRQWSAGLFGSLQVSDYIRTELHGGYTELKPQSTSTNVSSSSASGMYFGLSVAHRVNRWLDYTFTADRSQNFQSYGQPYTTYNVRWSPNWNVLRKFSLSTPVWWQHGKQFYYYTYSTANAYDQYGAGLNLGRQLTQKLSSSLAYQFVQETSEQGNLNYTVNTISLNFTYQF